jgi:hypothetical protein
MDEMTRFAEADGDARNNDAATVNKLLALALTESYAEIQRLRCRLEEFDNLTVIVFGSSSKLSVAAVTSSSADGCHTRDNLLAEFMASADGLKEHGVGFNTVQGVMPDTIHQLPFKSVGIEATPDQQH